MRKTIVKKLKKQTVKAGVKDSPSKPIKTGLSKSDPDYFKKIGLISAQKRQLSSEQMSLMAKASHPRQSYHGGRPKKEASENA